MEAAGSRRSHVRDMSVSETREPPDSDDSIGPIHSGLPRYFYGCSRIPRLNGGPERRGIALVGNITRRSVAVPIWRTNQREHQTG